MKLFKKKERDNKVGDVRTTVEGTFLNHLYQMHNLRRLQHLESLGLDLNNKKVVEFGAGIGDHTLYYLFKNCTVLPTEGRKELVDQIKGRYEIDAIEIDVEKDLDKIKALHGFDIVHCYGLLYHINNPKTFIESIKNVGETFLLETAVSEDTMPDGPHLVKENQEFPTQAISGQGCRPTRTWLLETLRANFPHVYMPLTQPKHEQFPNDWTQDLSGMKMKRAIFIASHKKLDLPILSTELPKVYKSW